MGQSTWRPVLCLRRVSRRPRKPPRSRRTPATSSLLPSHPDSLPRPLSWEPPLPIVESPHRGRGHFGPAHASPDGRARPLCQFLIWMLPPIRVLGGKGIAGLEDTTDILSGVCELAGSHHFS